MGYIYDHQQIFGILLVSSGNHTWMVCSYSKKVPMGIDRVYGPLIHVSQKIKELI